MLARAPECIWTALEECSGLQGFYIETAALGDEEIKATEKATWDKVPNKLRHSHDKLYAIAEADGNAAGLVLRQGKGSPEAIRVARDHAENVRLLLTGHAGPEPTVHRQRLAT